MRTFRFLNLAILSVLVGSAALVYAQEDKQEDKPARQEEAKPQPKQEEAKPAHQEEAKPSKQDKQEQDKNEQKEMNQEQSHEKAMPARQEHPEQQQAHSQPAGKGGHIPDDKFRSHFGHGHTFKAKTVIVSGQPRFQYGGYSFELVDVWPAEWAYTDDCYIDYIDGEYFLFDLLHPGVRIAVFVVL